MYLPPGKLAVEILERLIRTYATSIHGVVVGGSIGRTPRRSISGINISSPDGTDRALQGKQGQLSMRGRDFGSEAEGEADLRV